MTHDTAYIRLCSCGRIPAFKQRNDVFWLECVCGKYSTLCDRKRITDTRWETDWQVFERVIKAWNKEVADADHD